MTENRTLINLIKLSEEILKIVLFKLGIRTQEDKNICNMQRTKV